MPKLTLDVPTEAAAKALAEFLLTQPAITPLNRAGEPLKRSVLEYVAVLIAGEQAEAHPEGGTILTTEEEIRAELREAVEAAKQRVADEKRARAST